jgi:hypothetical protein
LASDGGRYMYKIHISHRRLDQVGLGYRSFQEANQGAGRCLLLLVYPSLEPAHSGIIVTGHCFEIEAERRQTSIDNRG